MRISIAVAFCDLDLYVVVRFMYFFNDLWKFILVQIQYEGIAVGFSESEKNFGWHHCECEFFIFILFLIEWSSIMVTAAY